MYFGIVLELADIDLWNVDLLDTHLDLLDIDIPSKYFVCLHSVFKTSSRYVFKTSSRHVFKTSSRRLQRNNFSSSKTSSRRLARGLENVFKTSSRRLGRRKIVTLKTCWRRFQDTPWTCLQDVFKTNKCLLGSHLVNIVNRPGPHGGFVPPREGSCLTGVFEFLIICSLWNWVVSLMAKWHWAFTGGVSRGPKSHLWGFHRKNW